MMALSVIIPARNEMFLAATIQDVLANARGETEVIAVLDGYWPDPPIQDHPRVTVVHCSEPIGQRAATNVGARVSQAKYIMKLDAHCGLGEGFDVALMQDCEPDWTMVPSMHNFHVFDWECTGCGRREYQGDAPKECPDCCGTEFKIVMVWKKRYNKPTVAWRFDREMHFQYWNDYARRPEAAGDLVETLSFIGACMFLPRERFWELGGMDEAHGSWGQFGTEIACKTWLSGGKLVTTRKTWFGHMFRTGNFRKNGGSTWPYPISQNQIDRARAYSRDLWLNDRWPGAKHKLEWLIEKFKPIPDWHT